MKTVFGYIRVSTAKQGEKGVSLQEQRDAIDRYCRSQSMEIAQWFEERQTAAKGGRKVFDNMLCQLVRGRADGVVIHKIDRSARNLADWAHLGELIDSGIDVHFANESLDMRSRGGRLSADIQAVVAADYIRNLREESKKGLYGRLKQGLYPLPAPIGYLDRGKGNPKEFDPDMAPLVRTIFELYATGKYTVDNLVIKARELGLYNKRQQPISANNMYTVLHNPFYAGIIKIRRTNEYFNGIHPPLISKSTFDRVQDILSGRQVIVSRRHEFTYRRQFRCARCKRLLVGELQKGHVYYRCHGCPNKSTCVRESTIETGLMQLVERLQFDERQMGVIAGIIDRHRKQWSITQEGAIRGISLQLEQLATRMDRLTDAYLDKVLDKESFEERKKRYLSERKHLEEQLASMRENGDDVWKKVSNTFELANRATNIAQMGLLHEKRELLEIVSSNRIGDGKNVELEPSFPFSLIVNRQEFLCGAPYRDEIRTFEALVDQIVAYYKEHPNPNTPSLKGNKADDHGLLPDVA